MTDLTPPAPDHDPVEPDPVDPDPPSQGPAAGADVGAERGEGADDGAGTEPTEGDVAATYCATLVDEWARLGLSDAVVSPGSRSTPMAVALLADERVAVHVHHDERSAAFMALGLSLVSRRPTIVLCTSGTAAAEFHAAVVEAHQAYVPLLVLTADRPPELHDVGAPQTIDQRELYGTAVRWYCEPGAPTAGGAPWWRDLARDAWLRCGGPRPGPVHLDLAFREPLLGQVGELPEVRPELPAVPEGPSWGLTDEALAELGAVIDGRRGLIVAGVRATRDDGEARAVADLADALGWPVLADASSGLRVDRPGVVTTFDPLVRDEAFAAAARPEVVIRLGGLLSSKELGRFLATSGAFQVGVDPFGPPADPDRVITRPLTADVAMVCDQLRSVSPAPAPAEWLGAWIDADATARRALGRVLTRHGDATEPATAVDLPALLPDGARLVVSSSMPVRDLEWYAAGRSGLQVFSNRGANGIDGVVSTAVGVSLSGAPTALLIGDVAFLHDTNGLLGLARRRVDLVIVVVDNDGGGIFSFLGQHDALDDDVFETLFGTPHGVDLCALAQAHGIPAERVSTRAGVQAAVAGALTRGGTRVVVVDSDRELNVVLHRELNHAVSAALAAHTAAD